MIEPIDQDFEALLDYLYRNNGFDFTGYKRSSLMRRVSRRIEQLEGISSYVQYLDHLQVHPEEFRFLFNTILINVTGFFRDRDAWAHLTTDAIPNVLDSKAALEPIRVWSAGCSSGEEAYTLAMVLAEAMGADAFMNRVKVYATDVDEEALAKARHGAYTAKEVAAIPPELVPKYFDVTSSGQFMFRGEYRRSVIFGRHDLLQDAPISRLDVLVCRNVLMYFTTEVQRRILARLHFAVSESGVLFLGRAEMLLTHSHLFVPVELRHRIFARATTGNARDRLLILAQTGDDQATPQVTRQTRLREMASDASPIAQLLVDSVGALTMATDRARALFGLHSGDLGRPFHDLEVSYRPAELRSSIEEAYQTRRPVQLKGVTRQLPDGTVQIFDVAVTPLSSGDDGVLGVSVTFIDVTGVSQLQAELGRSKQDLETAYEEIQSANEELETTNEELQSTVEELETTNEELQSANEELETTNEELQSTNSELQAINQELRLRSDEVDHLNAFTESVLTAIQRGVVAVGLDQRIQVWTDGAEDLWGLRADEVIGQDLMSLDIGLPVAALRDVILQCSNGTTGSEEVILDAVNRRGKPFQCRVVCSPLENGDRIVEGVVLTMESSAS